MAQRTSTDLWIKKARWLTQALIISGTLNVGLLCTFIYSAIKGSRSPISLRPYPGQEIDLSQKKGLQELFTTYSTLSFQDLLLKLTHASHIEAGFTQRDVALACLTHFHHFSLEKALGGSPLEKREVSFTYEGEKEPLKLEIFPGLTNSQYQAIISYAKTEKWPLTARGLFLKLQTAPFPYDSSLLETFYLTGEFHYLQLLFAKTGVHLKKEHLATILIQSSWSALSEIAQRLRTDGTFTLFERRQFLLELVKQRSRLAAKILLEADHDYCLRDLDNETIINLCTLLGDRANSSFLKGLLESPRPDAVWKRAASILYEQAAEQAPEVLDLDSSKQRFIDLKTDCVKTPVTKTTPYTVVPGDSLWQIARSCNTSVDALRKANSLKSDTLKVGQTLKIPQNN